MLAYIVNEGLRETLTVYEMCLSMSFICGKMAAICTSCQSSTLPFNTLLEVRGMYQSTIFALFGTRQERNV